MLEIAKSDVLSRMDFDNPWWNPLQGRKIAFSDKPRRKYFSKFYEGVRNTEVRRATVVMGPRRVGKTVMIYHAISELIASNVPGTSILYVSLETPIFTGLSLERILDLYLEKQGIDRDQEVFVFFDEVQYLKNWEVHLKSLVDSYPTYRFVATGSAAAALRLKSNESGAGRFSDFILPPLTFAEYLMFIGKEETLIQKKVCYRTSTQSRYFQYSETDIAEINREFINYLNYGGYPEAVFSEAIRENPEQYIKSDIIDKVLLRDLPSLYGISNIQELNRLFTTLAYNTSCEVSLDDLSKSSGVAKNTIRRYLDYLEAAFLIKRVERVDQNARRFKRAVTFKVYLTNPSMKAALFGQIAEDSEGVGALVETAVFSQWLHSNSGTSLCYARWSSGEIDIVNLQGSGQRPNWAVEVKWSDRHTSKLGELQNCVDFVASNPRVSQPILVTTRTVTAMETYRGVRFDFRPASVYAYTLGANILKIHDPNALTELLDSNQTLDDTIDEIDCEDDD